MPYPSQTDTEQIIEAATKVIVEQGYAHLSFSGLAKQLHVKAPSLYRYFDNRAALLQVINTRTHNHILTLIFSDAASVDDPYKRLMTAARIYRAYAHEQPNLFLSAYMTNDLDMIPLTDRGEARNAFMQAMEGIMTNEQDAIQFIRGLRSLAHGFILNELTGAFWRSKAPDQDYEFIIGTYLRGALS